MSRSSFQGPDAVLIFSPQDRVKAFSKAGKGCVGIFMGYNPVNVYIPGKINSKWTQPHCFYSTKTIDLHGILNGISWDFERNSSGIFVSENGGRSKIAI